MRRDTGTMGLRSQWPLPYWPLLSTVETSGRRLLATEEPPLPLPGLVVLAFVVLYQVWRSRSALAGCPFPLSLLSSPFFLFSFSFSFSLLILLFLFFSLPSFSFFSSLSSSLFSLPISLFLIFFFLPLRSAAIYPITAFPSSLLIFLLFLLFPRSLSPYIYLIHSFLYPHFTFHIYTSLIFFFFFLLPFFFSSFPFSFFFLLSLLSFITPS